MAAKGGIRTKILKIALNFISSRKFFASVFHPKCLMISFNENSDCFYGRYFIAAKRGEKSVQPVPEGTTSLEGDNKSP